MVALIKNQPKLMNLKIIIKEFVNHRKTIIIKRTIYKLKEYQNKQHILEGYLVTLTNIDKIIKIIKSSKKIEEIKDKIKNKKNKVSSKQ
jgi:DNA gyrase subunit A